ncbi:MAG: serine/threonine protein phosphatase 1 [Phenylobacterium sp.]|jgi:serine/threonine protein phosphatase 1
MDLTSALFTQVKKLALNANGRDFVCGDIHGEIGLLKQLLAYLDFDKETDRLIACGDLIDRGQASLETLQLLKQPWFHSVVGNHEQLLLSACKSMPRMQENWFANGGQWWLSLNADEKAAAQALVEDKLTLAIELELADKTIGIIHADFPEEMSWQQLHDKTFFDNPKNQTHCLWSRARHRNHQIYPIKDIDYLITGHTPLLRVTKSENVICLDTGSGYQPSLRLPHPALSLITFEAHHISVFTCNQYFGVKQLDNIAL